MNTSTIKPRYTVITLTSDQVNELRKGWQKNSNVQSLISHQYTEKHCYTIHGFYVNDQLFWTCVLKEITGKSGTKDQAIPQSEVNTAEVNTAEVKPVTEVKPDNFKPLQARVIGVNDPLDRLRENKAKFEVGSFYDYGFIIEIVKRSEKTITYRTPGQPKLTTRKIQDTDPRYETFYPDKNSICSSKNKVRESLPESQNKTTDNNLSTFKAGQVYKIGDRVDIALRITEANDKTVKVHFLIEVYDKKTDCWQWWESKENKSFRVTNFKTLQQITLNYSTFMNIGTVSVRSNQLNPINYQHSVKTAINNNSLPAEVKNKLLFLNGNRSGSYYSYDNK